MKKYSLVINIIILVVISIIYFLTNHYLAVHEGIFYSLLKDVLYIGILLYFAFSVENFTELLHPKKKTSLGKDWNLRAKIIVATVVLGGAIIYTLLFTQYDSYTLAFAFIVFLIIYSAYIIRAYYISRKTLQGQTKEEVFK